MALQLELRPVTQEETPLARTLTRQGRRASWVAAQLGVHRNTVSRWVNGREPIPRPRVTQLARLLDVDEGNLATPSTAPSARPSQPGKE